MTGSSGGLLAANGSWLGGQVGTQQWSDSANWIGGTVPGATSGGTNADIATFGSNTAATLITVDAGRNVRSLLFNGTDPAGFYTLGSAGANLGEALRLSSGGNITMAPGTLTTTTIHAPLILEPASGTTAGVYTITNNSTNVPAASSDTNPYKLHLLGDLTGGVTTSTITLNFTGTAGNRMSNPSANVVSGLISNGGATGGLAVTVTGSDGGNRGAWSFTNDSNSYTGATTVGNGTLIFSSLTNSGINSAIGAGSVVNLNSGAQVKYVGGATSTNRTINASGGALYAAGTGAVTLTGLVQLSGGITWRGGQNFIVNTVVTGTGDMNRTDDATVFLNQINTFTGNIGISQGAYRFATIANKGVVSAIGAGSTIRLGQDSSSVGRLEFTGVGGGSSNRDFTLSNGAAASSGNGRIDNMVAGQTLALSGWVRSTNANAAFVSSLNLTGVGNGLMSGVIGGTTGSPTTPNNMTLTKNGAGTWALSGANIYYGPTTISAGTLLAMNVTGSATGTGNVTTSASGGLGGIGIVSPAAGGSVTIGSGTRLMVGTSHGTVAGVEGAVGYVSGPGQLTLGSAANVALTLAGQLQFDLFSKSDGVTPGSADRLVLNTTATTVTLGGTVVVADSTGSLPGWRAGTWQLVDWTGVGTASQIGGVTFNLPTGSLASGYQFDTSAFLTTGSISVYQATANHTWTGDTNASWATPTNWQAGTVPSASDDVFFSATPSGVLIHAIDGNKDVRNLYFTGEANHRINTGTSGVLYSYGSLLQVEGGNQTVAAQLRIRNNSATEYHIANEGSLTFVLPIMYHRVSGNGFVEVIFSGAGDTTVNHLQRRQNNYDAGFTVNGPGTITFTGFTNTDATAGVQGSITGPATVNGGKLRLNDERNLGWNPAAFNPAQLSLNGGTVAAYASFAIDDENRGVTLGASGGTLEVESSHTLTLAVPVTGAGALSKTGPGDLVLSSANDYTGGTTVTTGALFATNTTGSATGSGALTVASAATLGGSGFIAATGANEITLNGTLAPGLPSAAVEIGTLNFATEDGDVVFGTGASAVFQLGSNGTNGLILTYDIDGFIDTIGGTYNGTGADRMVFGSTGTGLLDFTNASAGSLGVIFGTGYTPMWGDAFDLLDWSAIQGLDSSLLNLPSLTTYDADWVWDDTKFASHGVIAIIPEPSRALLCLVAMTGVLLRRRRQR